MNEEMKDVGRPASFHYPHFIRYMIKPVKEYSRSSVFSELFTRTASLSEKTASFEIQ